MQQICSVKENNSVGSFWNNSFLVLMVCGYIFLTIERPWESISYLRNIPIERPYAMLMILVALLNNKFFIARSPINKWVYGLLSIHFLFAPFAFSTNFAFDQGIEYAKMVVLYLLMLAVTEDEQTLKTFLKTYVITMILYALHSLWEFSNGRVQYRMGISRMVGVGDSFNDPNAFGASLLLSLPIAYVIARDEICSWHRKLYYSYFPLVVLCVVLTGSRSSFVVLATLSLLWVLTRRGKGKILIMVLVMIAMPIIWNAMPDEKQTRIRSIWDEEAGPANAHESTDGRRFGWKASLKMFNQKPWTGVGAGGENFVGYRIANQIDAQVGQAESPLQAHVLYGQVLAEFGIVGAFFMAGMVSSIMMCCVQTIRKYCDDCFLTSLSRAILLCLVLLLLFGFAGHNFYRPLWLWLASWAGSLVLISKREESISV